MKTHKKFLTWAGIIGMIIIVAAPFWFTDLIETSFEDRFHSLAMVWAGIGLYLVVCLAPAVAVWTILGLLLRNTKGNFFAVWLFGALAGAVQAGMFGLLETFSLADLHRDSAFLSVVAAGVAAGVIGFFMERRSEVHLNHDGRAEGK